jgi:lipopolysaccharide export system protein LptC
MTDTLEKKPPAEPSAPEKLARPTYRALQFRISPRATLATVRRYSMFVAFMKGALPMAALGLGIAVLVYAMQPRDSNQMALTFERMGSIENDLAMVMPRLTGTGDDGFPFVVTAATAVQESRGSDLVRLDDVNAEITLKEGNIHVEAAKGLVDTRQHLLDVSGGIRLTSDAGYNARTPAAKADLKAGTVRGENGIEATGSFGRITADRFTMNRETQQLRFTGNVRMLLNGVPAKQ